MRLFMKKRSIKLKKIGIVLLALVLVLLGAFFVYVNDYYKANNRALNVLVEYSDQIETFNRLTTIYPVVEQDNEIGIIFYPGGKVESLSYLSLLAKLSDQGFTSVLVDMPFNLAVFNSDGANRAIEKHPTIDRWVLVGHSLGGAMASSYVNSNTDEIESLILLAAYPINDADIRTIQIVGDQDLIVNTSQLSDDVETYIIEGGNHAYFGDYGEQENDGEATITPSQQQQITVDIIVDFILNQP